MPDQKYIFFHKPQINISYPSIGRMWLICVCAFFCILQSALSDGGRSLIPAFTALFLAILTELLHTWRNYGTAKIKDGSAAATAMLLCLLLPNEIHPVYAALGTIFAITVVKYSFGGLGSNWLNPMLGGWLFIRFSWPGVFNSSAPVSVTELSVVSNLSSLDNNITDFLNNSVFSFTGVQLPSGYIDLLFNVNPGLIADRGLFFLLLGTIVITATGVNRGWIPLVFLAVFGFFIRAAGDMNGSAGNGDLLYGIFSGGTIAAAFIIAAEPASSAKLKIGILFSVIFGAFLSWFFRYRCFEFTGCLIALALVNCITPLVRLIEEKFFLSRSNRRCF